MFISKTNVQDWQCVAAAYKKLRLFTCLLAMFILAGCAQTPLSNQQRHSPEQQTAPIVYYPVFGEKPQLTSPEELFALTQTQQAAFLKFYHSPFYDNLYPHHRIAKYVTRFIDGFNFHADTLIASDALSLQRGNCLTLGILTTALARVAKVEVGYELMQAPPVYQKKGRVVISSQHVRSILYRPQEEEVKSTLFMFQPVVKLDYFPTAGARVKRKVNESEFISMYYRNLAGDALAEDRLVDAYWLIVESLAFDEDNAHSTNILAIVYDRLGYSNDAEKLYQFAANKTDEKLEILNNYHNFLLRHKRYADAKQVKSEILLIDQPNPFDWLDLAEKEVIFGQLSQAKLYYRKVIELAPYLHNGYFGMSKVEYMRGNYSRAESMLKKALERTYEKKTKSLYQAKLFALTQRDQS